MTSNPPVSPEAVKLVALDRIWPDGWPRHRHLTDLALAVATWDADAPSVIFRDKIWTWRDAELWSGGVAAAILQRLGEGGGDRRVALLAARGPGIVVGMLGVAKAGYVLVPIDAAQPPERVKAILADAAPALILVDEAESAARLFDIPPSRILEIGPLEKADAPTLLRLLPSQGDVPAYILYTSGSTGRPKGVLCGHFGLCNLVEDRLAAQALTAASRLLLSTSISFDPAIYSVFLAAASGACLVCYSACNFDPLERGIGVQKCPPQVRLRQSARSG